jgi:serine/threonine-protein kinase
VLRTNPRAGTAVSAGSTVDLVIAQRGDQTEVPDVVGKDQVQAARALRADGLWVGSVTQEVSDQPPGTVLRTNPKAGTAVRPGSTVDLIVAKAPPAKPAHPGGGAGKGPQSADADRRDPGSG